MCSVPGGMDALCFRSGLGRVGALAEMVSSTGWVVGGHHRQASRRPWQSLRQLTRFPTFFLFLKVESLKKICQFCKTVALSSVGR